MTHRHFLFIAALLFTTPALAVVNGEEVSSEQFRTDYPWMVSIKKEPGGSVCNGVLIAPQWVLTAAHCTSIDKTVRVGHRERHVARQIALESSHRHPEFDKQSLQFDVGLLKLAEPIEGPVAGLATPEQALAALVQGNSGLMLGWGRTDYSKAASRKLLIGPLTIDRISRQGTQVLIESRGGGPCSQDSGGPLIFSDPEGLPVVIALASATDGELCNKNGGIAAYTSVSAVRSFIRQHVPRAKFD